MITSMVCDNLVIMNVFLVSIVDTHRKGLTICLVYVFPEDVSFHCDLCLGHCVSKNQPFYTFTFIHRIVLSYEWPYSKVFV